MLTHEGWPFCASCRQNESPEPKKKKTSPCNRQGAHHTILPCHMMCSYIHVTQVHVINMFIVRRRTCKQFIRLSSHNEALPRISKPAWRHCMSQHLPKIYQYIRHQHTFPCSRNHPSSSFRKDGGKNCCLSRLALGMASSSATGTSCTMLSYFDVIYLLNINMRSSPPIIAIPPWTKALLIKNITPVNKIVRAKTATRRWA